MTSDVNEPIEKVVIVGRDIAVWLSANVLTRALAHTGLAIEVIELPSYLRPHDVVGGLPPLGGLHHLIGLDEHELLKAVSGAYSLGQRFVNFAGPRPPFFHAYGSHGAPIGKTPFSQHYIRARHGGLNVAFEDFSLAASAAKYGRFFTSDATLSAFHPSQYAYHLKAAPYVRSLKANALKQGVKFTQARDFAVRRDHEGGRVVGLTLSDNRYVEGDVFIDATGEEGRLIGGGMESWAGWFPDNRVLTAAAETSASPPAYSQVVALQGSVLHMLPLQDMTGLIHAYHDEDMSDQQALEFAAVAANLPLKGQATAGALKVGRRRKAWDGNVIALGEAACVFNPISNVTLHALHLGLVHLVSLFPLDKACESEAQEYNRLMQEAYEGLRDFQICHFKLNRNLDQTYWDGARAMPIPERLQQKIDLFSACGRVPMFDGESFEEEDWLAIFFGHGLLPQVWDRVVERTSQDEVITQFRQMLAFIREKVEGMASHEAFIEIYAAGNFA